MTNRTAPQRCNAMNIDDLRQLVERKTEAVRRLEAELEKEDAELVDLERQLETLEDEREPR